MPHIPLEQWDAEVKPLLQKIALNCGWIIHYARGIEQVAAQLQFRPNFETEARAAMIDALNGLQYATRKLNEAKDAYDSKKKENEE